MPRYDYECEACGHVFEVEQRMSEAKFTDCPQCQAPKLFRVASAGAGAVLKGIFPGQDLQRMHAADVLVEKAKVARKLKHYGIVPAEEKIKETDIDLALTDELPPIAGPPVIPGPQTPPCAEPT